MSAMKHLDLIAREVGVDFANLPKMPSMSDPEVMRYIMARAGFDPVNPEYDIDTFDAVIDLFCEAYHEEVERLRQERKQHRENEGLIYGMG